MYTGETGTREQKYYMNTTESCLILFKVLDYQSGFARSEREGGPTDVGRGGGKFSLG